MLYRALDAVSRTVGFHRINGVVVSGPRLEVVDTHPEDGIGMARVQPDVRFRCRAQVLRIHTIVHDTIMLAGAPRVIACPRDNGNVVLSDFELSPLRDSDMGSFSCTWSLLRCH